MIDLDFIKELMTSLIYFHFSLRLVDISDEILNSDVEMSNNENEDKNVIVSEVKAVPTAKKSNNKESKVWKKNRTEKVLHEYFIRKSSHVSKAINYTFTNY